MKWISSSRNCCRSELELLDRRLGGLRILTIRLDWEGWLTLAATNTTACGESPGEHNVAMLVSTTGQVVTIGRGGCAAYRRAARPLGPNGGASGPLRIVADSIVTPTVGESMALRLELDGRTQPSSSATQSTNDASIAAVGADGTISGRAHGEALITARLNADTATVRIWVQLPSCSTGRTESRSSSPAMCIQRGVRRMSGRRNDGRRSFGPHCPFTI